MNLSNLSMYLLIQELCNAYSVPGTSTSFGSKRVSPSPALRNLILRRERLGLHRAPCQFLYWKIILPWPYAWYKFCTIFVHIVSYFCITIYWLYPQLIVKIMPKNRILKITQIMTDMVKMAFSKVFLPKIPRLSQPKGMAASQVCAGWKQLWQVTCPQVVLWSSPKPAGISETWILASSSIPLYFSVGTLFTAWILIPTTQVLFMSIVLPRWHAQTPGATSWHLSKPTAPAPALHLTGFKYILNDSFMTVLQ